MQINYSKFLLIFIIVFFNILAASAKADQSVDECTFIHEKLKQLPAIGGEVVIPSGTYTCLSPIVLNQSNISLRGQGDVTLRLGNNINTPVIVMGDSATPPKPIHHVFVSNLKIDGNRLNQQSECWGGACDGAGTSPIRNNGITVRGLTNGRIENVHIKSARSGGIVTEKGCYDLIVDNLTSGDNHYDGFAGYETTGAKLTNLNLSHNLAAGISLDLRFNGNIFKNVKIEHNGDVGIFMRDSSSNIFENVSIADCGSHGVFIAQAEDDTSCPLGNEFQNLSVERSSGFGFRLNNVCAGNFLSGKASFNKNRNGCVFKEVGSTLNVQNKITCNN